MKIENVTVWTCDNEEEHRRLYSKKEGTATSESADDIPDGWIEVCGMSAALAFCSTGCAYRFLRDIPLRMEDVEGEVA